MPYDESDSGYDMVDFSLDPTQYGLDKTGESIISRLDVLKMINESTKKQLHHTIPRAHSDKITKNLLISTEGFFFIYFKLYQIIDGETPNCFVKPMISLLFLASFVSHGTVIDNQPCDTQEWIVMPEVGIIYFILYYTFLF